MGSLSDDLDRFLMTCGKQIYNESVNTKRKRKSFQRPSGESSPARNAAKDSALHSEAPCRNPNVDAEVP